MTLAPAQEPQTPTDLELESCALFFDFDGTLVDIAPTPDAVTIPQTLGPDLVALSRRTGGALAILSGRRIGDIDRMLDPHRLDVAGVHGNELRIGSQLLRCGPETPEIGVAARQIGDRLGGLPGIVVEDKAFSVAVHWRQAPEYEPEIVAVMTKVARDLGSAYRLQPGKCVVEIIGRGASKGTAMRTMLGHQQYRQRRPIVFGDDLTDETAFRSANDMGGISVRVGEGPSAARFQLPTAQSLRIELAAWASGGPLRAEWEAMA